jgi:hypothetical protein
MDGEVIPMATRIGYVIRLGRRTSRERGEIMLRRDFVSREYVVREVVLVTILNRITRMQ